MANGKVKIGQPIPDNKTDNKPYIFSPSDEGSSDTLFDDDDTSTMSMLSSEMKNIVGAQGKATPEEIVEIFEDLWQMYERKGSKANAKKEFAKLTMQEITMMRSHIPAYLQARPERQYRQDFERYIKHKTFNSVVYSKANEMLFDPESSDSSATHDAPQEYQKENKTITINGVTYR